jgi:hypothetical protein
MKLKLFKLTNKVKILGYVVLPLFIPTIDGRILELQEELYIIPGMNMPVLLGEDFQVNYQISIHCTTQETSVCSAARQDLHHSHQLHTLHKPRICGMACPA